jgi:adenylate kinase
MAGAGKSTQGKLLAKRLGCPWESSGDLHREKLAGKDRDDMLSGKLTTDEVTLSLLEKEFKKMNVDSEEFVFDGFPRSLKQAEWLVDKVKAGEIKVTAIIHLTAHRDVALARLAQRSRKDDTDSAIARRVADYEETILPILDYLRKVGMPVYDVDGDGTIKEVESNIHAALGV